MPYPELPEFIFSFDPEFDLKDLSSKLSTESYAILVAIKNIEDCKTYQETIQLIQTSQVVENDIILSKIYSRTSVVAIGDTQFILEENTSNKPFTYQLCSSSNNNNSVKLYMSIQLPSTGLTVTSFLYTLQYSNNQSNTNGYFQSTVNG